MQSPPSESDHINKTNFTSQPNDSFVEFNLTATNHTPIATIRDSSQLLSKEQLEVLKDQENVEPTEPSQHKNIHRVHETEVPLTKNQEEEQESVKEADQDEDSDWEEMEGTNNETVYDDKGKVLVQDKLNTATAATGATTSPTNPDHEKSHRVSSFTYTRINEEEQSEKYQTIDRKTNFLFEAAASSKTKLTASSEEEFMVDAEDQNFTIDNIHNETNDSTNQLATTKRLLNETQKFAYVGLVRLVISDMATELMKLTLVSQSLHNSASSNSKKFIKRMNKNQTDFTQWSMAVTSKLYDHLQLSSEEIHMIESLSKHGIEPEDLTKSLLKHTELVNKPTESQLINNDAARNLDATDGSKIEIDITWTIVCDLFLLLLTQSETFDARSRTLLFKFSHLLAITDLELCQFEKRVTETLQLQNTSDQNWEDETLMKTRGAKSKRKRYMYVGMATIGGALILGLSGGLLAPVIGGGIAAGLSTIGISGTAGFLAGAGGTTLVTLGSTAIGARAGSKGMLKRTGEVKTFEFVPLHNNRRANLIVTVSGWMSGQADDVRLPFSTIDPVMGDLYSLLWEPEILKSTGQTMNILASEILTQSIQQLLGATILTALMGAVQLPMALSKLTYLVDNPWNVSVDRAWKAGLILADTLMNKNLGDRPVTLFGFSLGSRVIYSCILELAKRGAFGIVENVILLGSPVVISNDELILARSAVSGRFVNGYNKKDWILGYLYRATSGGLRRVAGLSPVTIEDINVENFDCTNLVEGHMGYRTAIPKILKQLGYEVLSEEFIEIDEPDASETERQRKLMSEFDEVRKQTELESKKKTQAKGWNKWFKPKKKEWWQLYSEAKSANASKDNLGSGSGSGSGSPKQRNSGTSGRNEFDVDDIMDKLESLKAGEHMNESPGSFQEYKVADERQDVTSHEIESGTVKEESSDHLTETIADPGKEVDHARNIEGDHHKEEEEDDDEDDEFAYKGPVTMSFG
ncbi:hypothetical protein WICPIJ_008312 [Wickerhamomyces pijperi]|uniref:DUF726-domain-containing protein n=1 Tax=Wickerhamomyces pijperi TaxID=599730 RepID=A0A9P8PXM3_WICPI|nr:hypothetical protein WICPIJ_008312 [Wickerhamomyces pijperi]